MGDGHQHWCRECFREYFRQRGDLHRRQSAEAKRKRLAIGRRLLLDHLGAHPCADCAEPVVLEFDHVGEKVGEVSVLLERASLQAFRAEMERCEVVCANCHRQRTAARAGWRRLMGDAALNEPLRPRRARNVRWVYELLSRSACVDCGCDEPLVLDFDHVGEKRGGVMVLAWSEYSLKTLEKEVAGCEVRCCNCHRRRTAAMRGYYRSIGLE